MNGGGWMLTCDFCCQGLCELTCRSWAKTKLWVKRMKRLYSVMTIWDKLQSCTIKRENSISEGKTRESKYTDFRESMLWLWLSSKLCSELPCNQADGNKVSYCSWINLQNAAVRWGWRLAQRLRCHSGCLHCVCEGTLSLWVTES